ncbi:hypothetical protein ACW9HW_26950, partial [Pseudomonas sp. SDO5532_S415]
RLPQPNIKKGYSKEWPFLYLLKKSFRNNDLSLCGEPLGVTNAPSPDYAQSQTQPSPTEDAPSRTPSGRRYNL